MKRKENGVSQLSFEDGDNKEVETKEMMKGINLQLLSM